MSVPLKTRILLADDHVLVRHGLRMVLNAAPDLEVGAEAGDGAEAVELALREEQLHLAVLDVAMPRMTGLQAAAELARRRPDLKLLMLSMHDSEQYLFEALKAGASGYSWDPEMGLRASQISAPRARRALAGSLEQAVWEAHRPPFWDCRAPLDRRAVRTATPELLALALDLTVEAAPAAQGVALATQIVREPSSPLYSPGGGEALRAAAVIARRALVQSAVQD